MEVGGSHLVMHCSENNLCSICVKTKKNDARDTINFITYALQTNLCTNHNNSNIHLLFY